MTDIAARWPTKFTHDLRLEWEQCEHVIHIFAHRARTTRPPGPDRWADVVNDRDIARPGADTSRHTMGKFWTVDDDQDIRFGRDNGIGRFADTAENFWQARWNCRKPDNREIAEREKARKIERALASAA